MDSERSLFMIVAILLLIIAIRKAQRFRFIALNMYFLRKRRQHDLISALLTRGIRRIRRTHVQQRRAAWVYPRPQGWFEEMTFASQRRHLITFASWLDQTFQGKILTSERLLL